MHKVVLCDACINQMCLLWSTPTHIAGAMKIICKMSAPIFRLSTDDSLAPQQNPFFKKQSPLQLAVPKVNFLKIHQAWWILTTANAFVSIRQILNEGKIQKNVGNILLPLHNFDHFIEEDPNKTHIKIEMHNKWTQKLGIMDQLNQILY